MSTSYRRKSSFPGSAGSSCMVLLGCVLLAFSGIVHHGVRGRQLQQPLNTRPMNPPDSTSPPGGAHFRHLAYGLRTLARHCRFPGARRELLDLAASFERRANHLVTGLAKPSPANSAADLDPSAGAETKHFRSPTECCEPAPASPARKA